MRSRAIAASVRRLAAAGEIRWQRGAGAVATKGPGLHAKQAVLSLAGPRRRFCACCLLAAYLGYKQHTHSMANPTSICCPYVTNSAVEPLAGGAAAGRSVAAAAGASALLAAASRGALPAAAAAAALPALACVQPWGAVGFASAAAAAARSGHSVAQKVGVA